jgi:hypothetical protein
MKKVFSELKDKDSMTKEEKEAEELRRKREEKQPISEKEEEALLPLWGEWKDLAPWVLAWVETVLFPEVIQALSALSPQDVSVERAKKIWIEMIDKMKQLPTKQVIEFLSKPLPIPKDASGEVIGAAAEAFVKLHGYEEKAEQHLKDFTKRMVQTYSKDGTEKAIKMHIEYNEAVRAARKANPIAKFTVPEEWNKLEKDQQQKLVKAIWEQWKQGSPLIPQSWPCAIECFRTLAKEIWEKTAGIKPTDNQTEELIQLIQEMGFDEGSGKKTLWNEPSAIVLDFRKRDPMENNATDINDLLKLAAQTYLHTFPEDSEARPMLVFVGPKEILEQFNRETGISPSLIGNDPAEVLEKLTGYFVKVFGTVDEGWMGENVFFKLLAPDMKLETLQHIETARNEFQIIMTQQ